VNFVAGRAWVFETIVWCASVAAPGDFCEITKLNVALAKVGIFGVGRPLTFNKSGGE